MRKIIVLLSIVMLLVTGCSISKLDDTDIGKNMKILLSEKVKMHNVFYDGYKYYVPRGLTFLNKEEFNALLQDGYHNRYYLYVDVVSFYHRIEEKYKEDRKAYYSRELKNKRKFGYLEITEIDDQYFVEAMYHYAKIEVYVSKEHLQEALSNISSILSSIQYNRSVLETLIGENVLDYQEEEFDIFKSKRKSGDFLDYVEEYGKYYDKDNELPEEDRVEIEEEN